MVRHYINFSMVSLELDVAVGHRFDKATNFRLMAAKIVAVAWAQYKPMIAKADRAIVTVNRRAPHIEDRHEDPAGLSAVISFRRLDACPTDR
jgi:hypothetical protein